MPEESQASQAPQHEHGIEAHFKKHWAIYTIGIGFLGIIVILVLNYKPGGGSQVTGTVPTSATDPYGMIPMDQSGDVVASLTNLQSTLSAQNSILQNLYNQGQPTTGTGTTTTPTQTIFPWPTNTPGASNNFWTFTTTGAESAQSLANQANWGQYGASYFENYRNNYAILQNVGYDFSHPNSPLPAGVKVNM